MTTCLGRSWRCGLVLHRAAVSLATTRELGLVANKWERRRFYKEVSVYKTEEGVYGVNLDHRRLRTPQRELLLLPTEPLALAVAHEWASQESTLQPSLMHLTALCNTVVDNPHQTTQATTVEELLSHLETDTLLFRPEEPEDLVVMQTEEWNPAIDWFNDRFGTQLEPSMSFQPPFLSPASLSALSLFLTQLDRWTLQGFHYAVVSCHSVVLTAALMEGHLNVETTTDLSRLEIRHQVQRWGSVEWQHDVEYEDLMSRLSAAQLMAQLANWPSV